MKRGQERWRWQRKPGAIQTKQVQLWRNGIMLTAQLTREDAQEMVQRGQAFVICSQAISNYAM